MILETECDNLLPDEDKIYNLGGTIYHTIYLHKGSELIQLFAKEGYHIFVYEIHIIDEIHNSDV